MRLVSLTCSNTEIVCALGCGGALVDGYRALRELVTELRNGEEIDT